MEESAGADEVPLNREKEGQKEREFGDVVRLCAGVGGSMNCPGSARLNTTSALFTRSSIPSTLV